MSQSSPVRKKQRLSSPLFDGEFDAAAFEALDRIELSLSQRPAPGPSQMQRKLSRTLSQEDKRRRLDAIKAGLQGGDGGQSSQAHTQRGSGLMSRHNSSSSNRSSATRITTPVDDTRHKRSSSNSGLDSTSSPQEPDYSNFFKPAAEDTNIVPGFQTGSSMFKTASIDVTSKMPETPVLMGFTKASKPGSVVPVTPSKAALEAAARRLKVWEEEDLSLIQTGAASSANAPEVSLARPILASVLNSPGRKSTQATSSKSFSTPIRSNNPRAFKSPLLSNSSGRKVLYPKAGPTGVASSQHSARDTPLGFRNARAHPLSSTPIIAHDQSSASLLPSGNTLTNTEMRTPERPTKPVSAGKQTPKIGFVTPFKPGMKPGDPARVELERSQRAKRMENLLRSSEALAKPAARATTRSNVPGPSRTTLQTSGLWPQKHTADELQDMGIDVNELSQITPALAPFYAFNAENFRSSTHSHSTTVLGHDEALAHLLRSGRNLATSEWATNHWSLILWKLAGMVCLDPSSESIPSKRRWCWEGVIRQLEHRYDLELAGGQRPAFRLITAHDAPAAAPMVLCVSKIIWPEEGSPASSPSFVSKKGAGKAVPKEPLPELEVTDGWYRLRAQVDEALARACKKGTIRVGRKLAVVGAKLDSQKKDPAEVLKAYDSTTLVLSGNSTHLAQWHAKLGFQTGRPYPFVATLHSLSADGGNVSVMDLVIEKVHPVAFLEFTVNEKGKTETDGPWNEVDETRASDIWKSLRDAEESKVQEEINKRWSRWEGFEDRLERLSARFQPGEDEMPPDHIEDLFDELDCTDPSDIAAFFRKINSKEAGWLARFLRGKSERDREMAGEEIQAEVNEKCPPRDVRNFRVVVARDAVPSRKAGGRRVVLTIWDVLNLAVSEGDGQAGRVEVGQRFILTNLSPTQKSAWMRDEDEALNGQSDIYLSTKRNSRFVRLK